ncbi:MAG: cryptochrome/photolyase family protein [Pseudomonadota bacterium]
MSTALLVFPHQLFADHPGLERHPDRVVLIEDPLFFGDPQYPARFHKQKLWLHRASMARYRTALEQDAWQVDHVGYAHDTRLMAKTVAHLASDGIEAVIACDPVDHMATKRLEAAVEDADLTLELLASPAFLNTRDDNQAWAKNRKRWFMAEFYKHQRTRLDVLMEGEEPAGGRWSFDEENRKKVPKALLGQIPEIPTIDRDAIDEEARTSVDQDFPDAPGSLETLPYPTSHADAEDWLARFLDDRFARFGDYEDAIVEGESWLWHSVLTPALNIGLLTPRQILDATQAHAAKHDVPLNSVEGFVRQIIGWREFMRATYEDLGVRMRTTNHWKHSRALPQSFYDATTGIDPIDDVIRRILATGYCHHIERLMVLGGFMFLCEIDPDDVYRWFMEMFVDSYDWVMVPNAYAMSQHADGGLITTKPYFSGSNYIRKMSHYPKGAWAEIWDGLYWRFIWQHRESLRGNRRWAMMCTTVERMKDETRESHLKIAADYLRSLSREGPAEGTG